MIAIIGGGIAGCCIALELARRGIRSTLFEASDRLMSGASRWNEGKLHLGFVYANDPSLRTAKAMIAGSSRFRPLLETLLETRFDTDWFSNPFDYAVPDASMLAPDTLQDHFRAVDRLLEDNEDWALSFCDLDLNSRSRAITDSPRFHPNRVQIAVATPEVAINPHKVAEVVSAAVLANPAIEVVSNYEIETIVRSQDGFTLRTDQSDCFTGFRQVVNSSWRSLLGLDAKAGLNPDRAWVYRYKHAIHVAAERPTLNEASTTLVLGPFGDEVRFRDGHRYLSWYPVCRTAFTTDTSPRDDIHALSQQDQLYLYQESLAAMERYLPNLSDGYRDATPVVRGGWILGHGDSDIDDRSSDLHRRDIFGVRSKDRYHGVNTGKYCLAPAIAHDFVKALIA